MDLPLRCACGALQGTASGLSARTGNRLVCHCDDCQAFAEFLGHPRTVLDPWGGTDILQTSPARVAFAQGAERLAVVRLTPRGLLRWYAACCRQPIGNTLPYPGLPFVGLIVACLHDVPGGPARDAVLGPRRGRVFVRFARGDPEAIKAEAVPLWRLVPRVTSLVLAGRLRGDHRRNPFVDRHTGTPVATPRVLLEAEREALRRHAP